MKVELPLGELVDRLTILELKRELLSVRFPHYAEEYETVWYECAANRPILLQLREKISGINRLLWHLEDRIRLAQEKFDQREITCCSYLISHLNSVRSVVKNEVNAVVGDSKEAKTY